MTGRTCKRREAFSVSLLIGREVWTPSARSVPAKGIPRADAKRKLHIDYASPTVPRNRRDIFPFGRLSILLVRAIGGGETPVPIPNTAVKAPRGDDSAFKSVRKQRGANLFLAARFLTGSGPLFLACEARKKNGKRRKEEGGGRKLGQGFAGRNPAPESTGACAERRKMAPQLRVRSWQFFGVGRWLIGRDIQRTGAAVPVPPPLLDRREKVVGSRFIRCLRRSSALPAVRVAFLGPQSGACFPTTRAFLGAVSQEDLQRRSGCRPRTPAYFHSAARKLRRYQYRALLLPPWDDPRSHRYLKVFGGSGGRKPLRPLEIFLLHHAFPKPALLLSTPGKSCPRPPAFAR